MPRLPLRTSLLAAVAGVALAAGAARRVLLVVTVEGTSMTPTYPPGTRLLVVRTPVARARTGAAVVFRLPPVERGGAEPPLIVKRVAARAGDPVPPAVRDAVGTRDGGRVPRGSVVLLGDDPATSTDSRAGDTWPGTGSSGGPSSRTPRAARRLNGPRTGRLGAGGAGRPRRTRPRGNGLGTGSGAPARLTPSADGHETHPTTCRGHPGGHVPESRIALREADRAAAERLLARLAAEQGPAGGGDALLRQARERFDEICDAAGGEYVAYQRALEAREAPRAAPGGGPQGRGRRSREQYRPRPRGRRGSGGRLSARRPRPGLLAGAALVTGAAVGAAGRTFGARPPGRAAGRAAAPERGAPGGPEQLRLLWLAALERARHTAVPGERPDAPAAAAAAEPGSRRPSPVRPRRRCRAGPPLRGADRSAAARRRTVLEQSFGQLPEPEGPFAGRRAELAQIAQWVHPARASTTEPSPPWSCCTARRAAAARTLAVRAARQLRDQFRGACVVDLRGDSAGEPPLPTRDALLHLLNRLGAPREQLLFRERSAGSSRSGGSASCTTSI